jgi:hypothetical protein
MNKQGTVVVDPTYQSMLIRSADSISNVAIPFSRRQRELPASFSLMFSLSLTLDHADVYLRFTHLVSLVILPLNDAGRWAEIGVARASRTTSWWRIQVVSD